MINGTYGGYLVSCILHLASLASFWDESNSVLEVYCVL